MVWTVGVRSPGQDEYEVLERHYRTCDEAERELLAFVFWELEKNGYPLESAVYCDGVLDHTHGVPRKMFGNN